MRAHTNILILSSAAVLLSACSNGAAGLRKNLGLEKEIPDEFAVITQAPLEMPRELTLPKPSPGQVRPQETPATTQAQKAIFGQTLPKQNELSTAESILLHKTGGSRANKNIRETINAETQELKTANQSAIQKIMKMDTTQISVVDAKKEHERIKNALLNGQPITTGETPVLSDDEDQ